MLIDVNTLVKKPIEHNITKKEIKQNSPAEIFVYNLQ